MKKIFYTFASEFKKVVIILTRAKSRKFHKRITSEKIAYVREISAYLCEKVYESLYERISKTQ